VGTTIILGTSRLASGRGWGMRFYIGGVAWLDGELLVISSSTTPIRQCKSYTAREIIQIVGGRFTVIIHSDAWLHYLLCAGEVRVLIPFPASQSLILSINSSFHLRDTYAPPNPNRLSLDSSQAPLAGPLRKQDSLRSKVPEVAVHAMAFPSECLGSWGPFLFLERKASLGYLVAKMNKCA